MYPRPYVDFLTHFHGTRDYFECHEELEELWKETEPGSRDSVWVLLIQFAVSLYHFRRGNLKGAEILINKTFDKLSINHKKLEQLGIDSVMFTQLILEIKDDIQSFKRYQSPVIPIYDENLIQLIKSRCEEWGVIYGTPSDFSNTKLINKHMKKFRN
ncbi:DUF309 domain-containing protein [Halobacillus sp. A1]|uniref:DUF309 domain-containing protein n=1 Tax=Halobacillus sp. A1 TaxID=2880262 RepID=UPI0020A64B18|nr:DUF309 domain-containing protein [Halobacillus sp. A1]MCP3032671.1 DUF309 domain-containing protein [Halobacillus sp. A1]